MTNSITLESLEAGLREPFALEEISFLPKVPTNEGGKWTCLALPYADKRVYEDRLNELAFGLWSTPPNPPFVAGNKLVIPVTVLLCGVQHTDYGEAFLSSLSRKGEMREEENSATEAYSQGFRRACAQFRLGRYLYSLPKARVPYDPTRHEIALSAQQKRELAERLYRKVGLLPAVATSYPVLESHTNAAAPNSAVPSPVIPAQTEQAAASATEAQVQRIHQLCQTLKRTPPDSSRLSFQAASVLIAQLTRAYKERPSTTAAASRS
jgi:hypothetical protein